MNLPRSRQHPAAHTSVQGNPCVSKHSGRTT